MFNYCNFCIFAGLLFSLNLDVPVSIYVDLCVFSARQVLVIKLFLVLENVIHN